METAKEPSDGVVCSTRAPGEIDLFDDTLLLGRPTARESQTVSNVLHANRTYSEGPRSPSALPARSYFGPELLSRKTPSSRACKVVELALPYHPSRVQGLELCLQFLRDKRPKFLILVLLVRRREERLELCFHTRHRHGLSPVAFK